MTRRTTKGHFRGEYREADGEPEEIDAPVEVDVDPVAGVVRTKVRETRDVIEGRRTAIAIGYFQQHLRQSERRDAYANRKVQSFFKPAKRKSSGPKPPAGYVVCPSCSTGETDVETCPACDGAGVVKDEEEEEETADE